jgi:hypothetical protein
MSGRSENGSVRPCRLIGLLLGVVAVLLGVVPIACAAPAVASAVHPAASSPGHAPVPVFSGAYGLSCPRTDYCVAVGAYNANDVVRVLAELWNGSAWSVIPSPHPKNAESSVLNAVSCTSASHCVAVGSYTDANSMSWGLSELWNGSSWTLVHTPRPGRGTFVSLSGISCAGATQCVAVGSYTNRRSVPVSLAELWNGSSWSTVHTPNPAGALTSGLSAVSCAGESLCMAAGASLGADYLGGTLTELWNGSTWTIAASSDPDGAQDSYLNGVSCPTATNCQAVGGYQGSDGTPVTLAESWDGAAWSIVASPTPAGSPDSTLSAVSCASATHCLAVGRSYSPSFAGKDDTLAESWDGSSWAIRTSPSPSTTSNLDGVSCATAARCLAVGLFFNSSGDYQTLAENWNGSSLAIVNQDAVLAGVSCVRAARCVAVGARFSRGSVSVTLAERWNGTSWRAVHTPNPANSEGSYLQAVKCVSAHECLAVGYYYRLDNTRLTLIESWNGKQWSIMASPNPHGAAYSVLYSITCAGASRCMAVGSSAGRVLAERWNGSRWRIVPTADPSSTAYAELSSISCTSASRCLAVGYETDTHYHADVTLAERWNGAAWTIVPSAAPGESRFRSSALHGMSCSTTGRCLAVGYRQTRSGSYAAITERWTGRGWVVVGSPSPTGSAFAELSAISCVPTDRCLAVGDYFTRGGRFVPLSVRWNGTGWHLMRNAHHIAPPSGISYLLDVSCVESGSCLATGTQGDPANLEVLSRRWDGSA